MIKELIRNKTGRWNKTIKNIGKSEDIRYCYLPLILALYLFVVVWVRYNFFCLTKSFDTWLYRMWGYICLCGDVVDCLPNSVSMQMASNGDGPLYFLWYLLYTLTLLFPYFVHLWHPVFWWHPDGTESLFFFNLELFLRQNQ